MSLANLVARIAAGETPAEIMSSRESVPPVPPRKNADGTQKMAPMLVVPPVPPVPPQNNKAQLESWEQWQAAHPSPGTVPLTADETADIRAWLAFIGETDPLAVEDALSICGRFPDTKAHFLREARHTEARQVIAAREALAHAQVPRDESLPVDESVTQLAEAFYNHLFGPGQATGCCCGRTNRYCIEGKRLRDTYYAAAKEAGKLA